MDKNFDKSYNQFLSEEDPSAHKKAVHRILFEAGLEKEYYFVLKDKKAIADFFFSWLEAGKEETDENEKKGLQELGKFSKKYFEEKNYHELCRFYANVVLRHVVEYLHLENRPDFEKITDLDLYEKGLLPKEIFLQFFLIETLGKPNFNWSRGKEVVEQNLACLVVCFADIYDFLNG